jgi:hypothetical protein
MYKARERIFGCAAFVEVEIGCGIEGVGTAEDRGEGDGRGR